MNRQSDRLRPALLRMVTDGLHATIDAYLDDNLPLHRLAWELRIRLAALADLTDLRTLNRLHGHTLTVEHVHDAGGRGELTRALDTQLLTALSGFRATLHALTHTPTPTPTHRIRPAA